MDYNNHPGQFYFYRDNHHPLFTQPQPMNFLAQFKTFFAASEKEHTIQEVFYQAVNFRWEPINHDFLWSRNL